MAALASTDLDQQANFEAQVARLVWLAEFLDDESGLEKMAHLGNLLGPEHVRKLKAAGQWTAVWERAGADEVTPKLLEKMKANGSWQMLERQADESCRFFEERQLATAMGRYSHRPRVQVHRPRARGAGRPARRTTRTSRGSPDDGEPSEPDPPRRPLELRYDWRVFVTRACRELRQLDSVPEQLSLDEVAA